jgi:hypothetical protein
VEFFFFPLLLAGLLLAAVFAFLFPLVGFVITLPFRILGWVIGLFGWMLLLPLILVGAVFGLGALVVATLLGGMFFLVPFVPFALLALGIAWFVRRSSRHAAHA